MTAFYESYRALIGKLDACTLLILVIASFPLAAQERRGNAADIENGAALYRANCFACHGQDGDGVAGVDFRKGIRRASTDEEISRIILGGIPGTGMPATTFPAEGPELPSLIAYLHSMRETAVGLTGSGNAERGRALFEGKGNCLSCHRMAGKGSYLGPDLSEIGASRTPAELERSILDPGETVLPQNRYVRAVTRDGKIFTGRRLNEDTQSIELIDEQGRLVSLSKSDLREYTLLKTSSMPSYKGKLDSNEITDIVTYLSSQKGLVTP